MQKSEKKKYRILNILDWPNCSCYTCGPSTEEVIEKERVWLDPPTKEPTYAYYKYTWSTPFDDEALENSYSVAKTLDGVFYINDGDFEETTRDEYEDHLSYWHKRLSKDYIQQAEHEKELRRELYQSKYGEKGGK